MENKLGITKRIKSSMRHAVSTMKSSQHSDHSATMSRIFSPLLLILFTIGFTPDGFTAAEPIRVGAGLLFQSQEYQKEGVEAQRRLFLEDKGSSELAENWRSNGEALEPKWRDGDTVPLLPFSQYSRYSGDQLEKTKEISDQRPDHRQRIPTQIPHSDNYEFVEDRYSYIERDQDFDHRRNDNKGGVYRPSSVFSNKERETGNSGLKDITSVRYREAFQVRPDDYEQEFDDEEYLRPRPRKRRPPQNYEFALTEDDASLRERNVENKGTYSKTNTQNAVELKNLLKMQQEEGLSLSEILQRRNLTLNDLLGGKVDAISALKAKDEEVDDYVDKAEKMMSNSFTKVFTTPQPIWSATLRQGLKVFYKEGETMSSTSTTAKPTVQISIDISKKNGGGFESTSTSPESSTEGNELKFRTTIKPMSVTSSEENMSTLTSLSSATTWNVTPMLSDSNKASQNDTSNPKSNNRGVKFDGLDEDEIMEFSDFLDYKKGRKGGSPMWIAMQDEPRTVSPNETEENESGESLSTLSIEHILRPTEHTNSKGVSLSEELKDSETDVSNSNVEKETQNEDQSTLIETNTNHGKVLEYDYQDDGFMASYESTQNSQASVANNEKYKSIQTMKNEQLTGLSQRNEKSEQAYDNHNTHGKDKKYEDIVSQTESEARAEIFELFSSNSAAKRLELLLKSRNMSIDELIALRQRGSSKVHLAEISRLRSQKLYTEFGINASNSTETSVLKETNQSDSNEKRVPLMNPNSDETMHHANREIDKILQKSSIVEEIKAGITSENITGSSVNKESDISNENETFNRRKQDVPERMYQIVDLLTTFSSLPFAKDIQREFGSNENVVENKLPVTDSSDNVVNNEAMFTPNTHSPEVIESKYIEEIVKEEPNTIDIRTVFRETNSFAENERDRIEERKSLSRVKPSIIASAVILGVATIVFLTIFIICRVRQKQKYRYRNTFSRAVFQGPIMAARKLSSSSSLSNVMVNVVATSTTKRPERNEMPDNMMETDPRSDIDSDSLDATDSWETIPDYMK